MRPGAARRQRRHWKQDSSNAGRTVTSTMFPGRGTGARGAAARASRLTEAAGRGLPARCPGRRQPPPRAPPRRRAGRERAADVATVVHRPSHANSLSAVWARWWTASASTSCSRRCAAGACTGPARPAPGSSPSSRAPGSPRPHSPPPSGATRGGARSVPEGSAVTRAGRRCRRSGRPVRWPAGQPGTPPGRTAGCPAGPRPRARRRPRRRRRGWPGSPTGPW